MRREFEKYYLHLLLRSPYYEPITRYHPDDTFMIIVRRVCPIDWDIAVDGLWLRATPRQYDGPGQGWKIHVSTIPSNASIVLETAARLSVGMGIPFKCASDSRIAALQITKRWPREASGKFFVMYPPSVEKSREALEKLAELLKGIDGPYVLSDRRFAPSVFYRYGGFKGMWHLRVTGEREFLMKTPSGGFKGDVRMPYWNAPDWVKDPFVKESGSTEDPKFLGGRYRIDSALSFSVSGGVYLGYDNETGHAVVLKEARPFVVYDDDGLDAIERLHKEYAILTHLAHLGITPKPIEIINEWEHVFLVEEYIAGMDVGKWVTEESPLLDPEFSSEEAEDLNKRTIRLWLSMAKAIRDIHTAGVVLGDLSHSNILIKSHDGSSVCVVDLESAWRMDQDTPGSIRTPGFHPLDSSNHGIKADRYALGVLMSNSFFPVSSFFEQDPKAVTRLMNDIRRKTGLTQELADIPSKLMFGEESIDEVISLLSDAVFEELFTAPVQGNLPNGVTDERLGHLTEMLVKEIEHSQNLERNDSLFPGDPQLYRTNPLSVAYGACGVVYALSKLSKNDHGKIVNWILRHPISPDGYPPGLWIVWDRMGTY